MPKSNNPGCRPENGRLSEPTSRTARAHRMLTRRATSPVCSDRNVYPDISEFNFQSLNEKTNKKIGNK